MPEEKKLSLPADTTLTSQNFTLNPDGSVTIKNGELSRYLSDKLNASIADPAKSKEWVGVVWG